MSWRRRGCCRRVLHRGDDHRLREIVRPFIEVVGEGVLLPFDAVRVLDVENLAGDGHVSGYPVFRDRELVAFEVLFFVSLPCLPFRCCFARP